MEHIKQNRMPPRRLVWAVLAGIVALSVAMHLPIDSWITDTVTWFKEQGFRGRLVFAVGYFIAGLILLPIFPLTVFAGVVYGLEVGAAVVLPAAVLSATLAGWLGQTILERTVLTLISRRPVWQAICNALSGHGFRAVVLNRMAPLLPFGVQNYGLGAVGIRPRDHFLGTLVGIQPALWTALYIGTMVTTWAQAKQSLGTSIWTGPRLYLMLLGGAAILTLMIWLGRVALKAQNNLGGASKGPPIVKG